MKKYTLEEISNLISGKINYSKNITISGLNDLKNASNEQIKNEGLIREIYQGIRPAPGYPACPNHEVMDQIWALLNVEENAGISLTETKAMYPAASVCGWYFSYPESRYFSVSKIGL